MLNILLTRIQIAHHIRSLPHHSQPFRMNVFKKKGKAKDDTYIIPPAVPSDPAPPAKLSRSLKRKQKNVVEPMPQLDLTLALPDKTDFRTSLLMPGLTARFSMLREQDDPNTKVGKASDDSVLFPKRASRLNLFSHNPLTDIAETESIQTTFRAPFSDDGRSYSFSEGGGYASDDGGNVLSRPRPTEGNNLFGGRQKVYRIATASGSSSVRDPTEIHTPLTSAKHVYNRDVSLSPFQQTRNKAKEELQSNEIRDRPTSTDHEHSSVFNTPSTGFSKSRGTTSSTASGPSNRRVSTAATSVASDGPLPRQSNTSTGFIARTHGSDFGSEESLLTRNFSSESRKVAPFNETQPQPPLPRSPINNRQVLQAKSVTNLSERYTRATSPFSASLAREASPPPVKQAQALASLDFGLKSPTHHLRRYQMSSPTNEDEDDDVYSQSLQPNDRGKATAMGLFNRPQQQFDERKFEERQLQMHEGRMSPTISDGPEYGSITERQSESGRSPFPTIQTSPLSRGHSHGRESGALSIVARSRAQSNASSVNSAQVKAHAEALIRRQNEEFSTLQAQFSADGTDLRSGQAKISKPLMEQPAASRGTFFDTFDGSDDDDAESPMLGRYEPTSGLAPLDVHPALRDGSQTFDFGDHVAPVLGRVRPESNTSGNTSSPSVAQDTPDTSDSLHGSSHAKTSDSVRPGLTAGLGLSGLIRTHLKQDSDASSIMPPRSPAHPPYQSSFSSSPARERESSYASTQLGTYDGPFRDREPSIASTARTINPPESTHSDPWEFDTAHRPQRSPLEPIHKDATPSMSHKAQQILGQAISHRYQATSKAQQLLGDDAPAALDEHPATRVWQQDALSHHRGESTETQKEFGNELAERAKKIHEGLKVSVEAEKQSRSQDRQNPASQAFQAIRHKTSKTSLIARNNDPQPKAMKMLGIPAAPRMEPNRSPNLGGRRERDFEHGYDEYGDRSTPKVRPAEFEPPNGRRIPGFARPGPPHPNHFHEETDRPYQPRSGTPNSGRPRRDRAESEAAERSRSRAGPGRYREDQPYVPGEYGRPGPPHGPMHREPPRHYGHPEGPHGYPGPHPPRGPPRGPPPGPPPVDPRAYDRSASAMSNRRPSGNGSRPGPGQPPSNYFDVRAPNPTMTSTPQLGPGVMSVVGTRPSPRPQFPHSPISPFTPHGISPALSPLPAPLPSPTGPLPQIPTTGRSTPIGSRKKSVTKGMISEPTFISSTSSVPLVGLPNGPRPGQITSPPLPTMNPRRRGNTMTEQLEDIPSPRMPASEMSPRPESPNGRGGMAMAAAQRAYADQQQYSHEKGPPRPRNRLRKISSEGGSMAARARNQAIMAEFGNERLRSPAMPVFPNRSTTSLSMHQEGGMF